MQNELGYRVELKPAGKYKHVYEAATMEEITAWLDAHCTWVYVGTNGQFQARKHARYRMDVYVSSQQSRPDMMDDRDNVPTVWCEAPTSYSACTRTTPGWSGPTE